jgi:hypothetical protein
MPSTYTPVGNAWTASVQLPSDGDVRSAASSNVPDEFAADRTQHIFNGPDCDIHVPLNTPVEIDAFPRWAWQGFATPYWLQVNVAGAGYMAWCCPSKLITTGTGWVTGATARVAGDAGGGGPHGALPATLPRLWLYDLLDGVVTPNAQTDTSGGVAAYDAAHDIVLSGLSIPIVKNRIFLAKFDGETGAGSLFNALGVYSISLQIQAQA